MKTPIMEHHQWQSELCTMLDRDSILEIFKYLTSDDLCAVTKTCRKIQNIAGDQFRRKYMTELNISIWLKYNGEIDVFPKGKHVTCFKEQIQSVSIYDKSYGRNARFPKLLRECSDKGNMKEIVFHECNFDELFIEESSIILQNIKKIAFSGNIGKNNKYDDILEHCKQLKHINISDWTLNVSNFPQNTYPALEYFECTLGQRLTDGVATFLQRNPSIKKIVCFLAGDRRNVLVQKITQNAVNVEELYLNLGNCVNHLDSICETLNLLTERNRIKRMEFKLSSVHSYAENIDPLVSLKKLTGLHLASENLIDVLINNSFFNLNILQLQDIFIGEVAALQITHNLPNLIEIYMSPMSKNDIRSTIAPFACFSKKLKKMFIFQSNFKDCIQSISLFNEKRKVLEGACQLIIYVGKASSNIVGKYITPTNYDLVKLKLVEINLNRNIFIKHNPMIRFSHIEL